MTGMTLDTQVAPEGWLETCVAPGNAAAPPFDAVPFCLLTAVLEDTSRDWLVIPNRPLLLWNLQRPCNYCRGLNNHQCYGSMFPV